MRRLLGAAVLGFMLFLLWVGLWRQVTPSVLFSGAVLSLLPAGLALWGKVELRQPVAAWVRVDLWIVFLFLVALRVAQAVAVTAVSVITGKAHSGIVAVPVSVQSDMARLLLLWSITVTPGTIALLLEGDLLYVHCLCQPVRPGLPGLQFTQRLLGGLWG